jgi:hypothetical protein
VGGEIWDFFGILSRDFQKDFPGILIFLQDSHPGEKKNSNDYKNYPKSTMHSYG